MSHKTSCPIILHVRPAKHLYSLTWVIAIRSLDYNHLDAASEDSDQSVQMRRLTWVFAEHTYNVAGITVSWLKTVLIQFYLKL